MFLNQNIKHSVRLMVLLFDFILLLELHLEFQPIFNANLALLSL